MKTRRGTSGMVVLGIVILTVSFASVVAPTLFAVTGAGSHRLGFWLQEQDQMRQYSTTQFFTQYFLTSPYPSSMEMMLFGPYQDGTVCSGSATGNPSITQASINYWSNIASQADAYPNIQIAWMVAFDMNTQMSCLQSYVAALSSHHSTYSLGIEGEYARNQNLANMQTAMGYVTGAGKQFVSYYVGPSVVPSGGSIIGHTNFPGAGDQVGTLTNYQTPPYIGLDSGYYFNFPFPQAAITCPIGPSAIVTGSVEGWNQCVVSTELATAVSMPSGTRQFLELDPGFLAPKFSSFVDSAGITTASIWDHPQLRNWIASDPNYAGQFILSNSQVLPPPTTTTTSATTVTSTSVSGSSTTTITSTSSTTVTSTSGGGGSTNYVQYLPYIGGAIGVVLIFIGRRWEEDD